MDKKSIVIIVLLAVLVIFYWPILEKFGLVKPPEPPATPTTVDTVQLAPGQTPAATGTPSVLDSGGTTALIVTPPIDSIKIDTLVVETNKYRVLLSSLGGGPVSIQLKDYTYRDGRPIELIPNGTRSDLDASFGGGTFSTSSIPFVCNFPAGSQDATKQPLEVVYTYAGPNGGKIVRSFVFRPDDHSFDLKFAVEDPSRLGFEREYQIGFNTPLAPTEPDLRDDWTNMQAASMMAGSRAKLDDFNDGVLKQTIEGDATWVGIRSKYFASILIARSRNAEGVYANGRKQDVMTADGGMLEEKHITAGFKMPFASSGTVVDSFTVFAGPLDYMMMSDYNVGLQDMLDIGTTPYVGWIIKPFAIAIMWIMPILYGVFPNYGIVIIVFALLVKLITLPLSLKSFKSMSAMRELQPKVDDLKKRYPKDPQKLNTEMMKLYKEHGVSPLSGCLPMLPQMPLIFALFSVFRATILLRNAPFFWFLDDLSRGAQSFTDPYIILVLLMIVAQFYSQKLTMASGQQNKMLIYLMPLFMGFIFYKFAAGLVLYWTITSALSMVDYLLLRRKKNLQVKTIGTV